LSEAILPCTRNSKLVKLNTGAIIVPTGLVSVKRKREIGKNREKQRKRKRKTEIEKEKNGDRERERESRTCGN
jgi:hypothetical protein